MFIILEEKRGEFASYSNLRAKYTEHKLNLDDKITWNKLSNLGNKDLKAFNEDGFNPTNLIEKNTKEDNVFLKQYHFQIDPNQNIEQKINFLSYGKY